jgi:hypothetical protein
MPYAVSFDEEDGIVYVIVSGHTVKEDHYSARDEAFRICQEHACSKLLVDLRDFDASKFSITRIFAFGEALAKHPSHLRIAHILPTEITSGEYVKFASTVMANRGKSTGEFRTIEEGRQWLLENR